MLKKVKDKWVAALRSGDYKQGRNKMRSFEDEFCCLGVLCDIVDKSTWRPYNHGYYKHDGVASLPSDSIRKEVKITDTQVSELAELTDSGKDFKEIADYIEENL
jgi:hypothetical protein